MGRAPKKPSAPKAKDAANTKGKGGTVRGGNKPAAADKPLSPEIQKQIYDVIGMALTVEGANMKDVVSRLSDKHGRDNIAGVLKSHKLDIEQILPSAPAAAPPTNMVTENTVTTGSVVPVTSVDNALPATTAGEITQPQAAATPEQLAAIQKLGLKPAVRAAATPAAAKASKPLSIRDMIALQEFGALPPAPTPPDPPVLSQVRTVDPADVAGESTVQLRTGDVQPKPAPVPFTFPDGFAPGADDGRVQMSLMDYANMRQPVPEPMQPLSIEVFNNSGSPRVTNEGVRDIDQKTKTYVPTKTPDETAAEKPKSVRETLGMNPVDQNKGVVGAYRNLPNIGNRAALPLITTIGGAALIRYLMGGKPQQDNTDQILNEARQMYQNHTEQGGFR